MKELLLVTFTTLFVINAHAQTPVKPFDAVKQCEQEGANECHGLCMDGWAKFCYYDDTKVKPESNKSLAYQKDKCYGFHDSSVCEPCRNIYQIENKDVECKEFYNSINKKNKECDGCLKSTFNAGG
jgi:hypothetical protein